MDVQILKHFKEFFEGYGSTLPIRRLPGYLDTGHEPEQLVKTANLDINGDRTPDNIRFISDGVWKYTLRVNNSIFKGEGDQLYGDFDVLDIDSKDGIKEIAVSESGPSDDYTTAFYHYDGHKIIPMGQVGGANEDIKADGSGILKAESRASVLCTWFYQTRYRLSNAHKLIRAPQDLYDWGWRIKVIKALPLQSSRTNPRTSVILQPGEEVTFLASDDKQWCLVENSKGVKGWFEIKDNELIKRTGLDAYEYFEGLVHAD